MFLDILFADRRTA